MATRKQRRRREKEKRHDYEFVYVDEEGNEVEPEPGEIKGPPKRTASSNGKGGSKGSSAPGRGRRAPQPPSWRRVFRRAGIFLPLFVVTLLVLPGGRKNIGQLLMSVVILSVFFVPFSYFLDSWMWRSYQKKTGQRTNTTAKR